MVILFICLETGLDSNCYSQYQTVISMWFESQIQIKLKPTPASGASSQHFDHPCTLYTSTVPWYNSPTARGPAVARSPARSRDLVKPPSSSTSRPLLSVCRRRHNLPLLLPPLAFQTVESGGGDEQRGRHEGQKMDAAHSSSLNTSLETPSQANLRQCFPPDKAAFQCRDVIVWPSQRTRET